MMIFCFVFFQCDCNGNEFCERSKRNVKPCQDEVVYATLPGTQVSCTAAQWICGADPACSTAFDYYNQFCRAMFRGRKCTKRCKNSINILKRQKAASKLENCICDGTENYKCQKIKDNMDQLCFKDPDPILTNEIEGSSQKSGSGKIHGLQRLVIVLCVILGTFVNFVWAAITEMASSISRDQPENLVGGPAPIIAAH